MSKRKPKTKPRAKRSDAGTRKKPETVPMRVPVVFLQWAKRQAAAIRLPITDFLSAYVLSADLYQAKGDLLAVARRKRNA